MDGLDLPESLTLPAGKTVLLHVKDNGKNEKGKRRKVALPYKVDNVWVAPNEPLETSIELEISFGT